MRVDTLDDGKGTSPEKGADERWGKGVMETAVCDEMLGKVSDAIYFDSWASELANGDKTLGAKGEVLKSEMTEP